MELSETELEQVCAGKDPRKKGFLGQLADLPYGFITFLHAGLWSLRRK